MSNVPVPKRERLIWSITLAMAVAFLHLGALLWIGLSVRDVLFSPIINAPYLLECQHSFISGEELVLPEVRNPADDLMRFRFVNLKTGESRLSEPTTVVWINGVVSDGKRIWSFGKNDEVYETDGFNSRMFTTNYKLSLKPQMTLGAFLYEGRPAIVDRIADSAHRLLVLEDDDWVELGEVAYPGRRRNWIVDADTGRRQLVPEFLADIPTGQKQRFAYTKTVPDAGIYHQFQFEAEDPQNHECRIQILYRPGFDFTHRTGSNRDDPLSALAPENVPADTTGWEPLGPTINHLLNHTLVHNGELFLTDWGKTPKVIRIIPSDSFANPKLIEEFELNVPMPNSQRRTTIALVQSMDQKRLLAIFQPQIGESTLFEWNGSEFTPLPFKVDGILTKPLRILGMYLAEIVAVFWIGTFLFVVGSQWLMNHTGERNYSFGTDTLPLASILRRSVARCIDLTLIFAPIVIQLGWTILEANSQSIFDRFDPGSLFRDVQMIILNFAQTASWAILAWTSFVVLEARYGTTPGKYLCGIRVIRLTLRPCGIARSLVRELLFFAEAPFVLSAVPALAFCLGTTFRQRLGDLVADSIVVAAGGA